MTAPKKSGLAITALALSIASFILFCAGPLLSIPSLIMGFLAHSSARNKPREYGGGGLALAAMIVSAGNLLIVAVMCLWLFLAPDSVPVISTARMLANRSYDANNLRQILQATEQYANDHGGAYPPHLADATRYLSTPKNLVSKASGTKPLASLPASATDVDAHCDFIYTGNGLHRSRLTDPSHTIIAYEKDVYHGQGHNVLFADGRVEWLPPARFATAQADDSAIRAAMASPRFPHPVPPPTVRRPPATPSRTPSPIPTPAPAPTIATEKTQQLGGNGGGPFVRASPDGKPLLGVRYTIGSWGGRPVLSRVDPLFDRSEKLTDKTVLARDGYVVGGMNVKTYGINVEAVQLIFVRMNAGKINAADQYTSDWLGSDKPDATLTKLAGNGETVVGIFGRQGMNTDAIGLVILSQKQPGN
jgi:prepilin-type processing-associated H-X9-DG protein